MGWICLNGQEYLKELYRQYHLLLPIQIVKKDYSTPAIFEAIHSKA